MRRSRRGISQIAVDPSGGVYVLSSLSTAVAGVPPAPSLFVAKLSADGSGIAWEAQVPNLPPFEPAPVLAVDPQGRAYVAGESDTSNEVGSVARLKADGSGIDYIAKVAGSAGCSMMPRNAVSTWCCSGLSTV